MEGKKRQLTAEKKATNKTYRRLLKQDNKKKKIKTDEQRSTLIKWHYCLIVN